MNRQPNPIAGSTLTPSHASASRSYAGRLQPGLSTTVAPTTSTVPPLMAEELAWLKAVTTLHERMDKALQQNDTLTRAKMTSYATTLRTCSRELTRIGSPTDRLQPVHVIVKVCRTYDKGANC
jgi:hypothetical protein